MQLLQDIRRLAIMVLATVFGLLLLTAIRGAAAQEIRALVRQHPVRQISSAPGTTRPHVGPPHHMRARRHGRTRRS